MLGRAARPDVALPTDNATTAADRRAIIRQSGKPHMRVIDVVDNLMRHSGAAAPVTLPSLLALPPAFDMGGASLDGVLRELKARRRDFWPGTDWGWAGVTYHTGTRMIQHPHISTFDTLNPPMQPLVAEARALRLPCPDSLFEARSLDDLRLRVQRFRLLGARGLEEEDEGEEEEMESDMYGAFRVLAVGSYPRYTCT